MTLTISPKTEALLLARAERDGQDAAALADDLLADLLERDRVEETVKQRAQDKLPTHLTSEELFANIEAAEPL